MLPALPLNHFNISSLHDEGQQPHFFLVFVLINRGAKESEGREESERRNQDALTAQQPAVLGRARRYVR